MIKTPIITEKSISQYQEQNKVTFEVSLSTNRSEAKKEIEELYGVSVEGVKVINRLGKIGTNRITRKPQRKSRDKKIMIFKIGEKDKIDIFEQSSEGN